MVILCCVNFFLIKNRLTMWLGWGRVVNGIGLFGGFVVVRFFFFRFGVIVLFFDVRRGRVINWGFRNRRGVSGSKYLRVGGTLSVFFS